MKKKIALWSFLMLLLAASAGAGWLWYTTPPKNGGGPQKNEGKGGVFFGDSGIEAPDNLGAQNSPGGTAATTSTKETPALLLPKIWRVSSTPVAASYVGFREGEKSTWYIRYLERESGHIFEQDVSKRTPVKLSNTTVPRIQEAFWLPSNPDAILLRYLDSSLENAFSFLAHLEKAEAPQDTSPPPLPDSEENSPSLPYRLTGSFLEKGISFLSPSPSGRELFYLVPDTKGAVGKIVSVDDSTPRTVFYSPLKELLPVWGAPQTILLTTKPSEGVSGFSFALNPRTGESKPLIMGENALMANISPKGSLVVYTVKKQDGSGYATYSRPVEGGGAQLVPFVLIPEKCAWGRSSSLSIYCAVPGIFPSRGEPDNWYRGDTSFSDFIWKIDLETMAAELLATPSDFAQLGAVGKGVDGVNLFVDSQEEYLTLINRSSGILWAIRLHDPKLRNDGKAQ